jgi:hypothetical protein
MSCTCVSCGACRGLGQVMMPTNSYPEEDLETCTECDGSGVSDLCSECAEKEEDYE